MDSASTNGIMSFNHKPEHCGHVSGFVNTQEEQRVHIEVRQANGPQIDGITMEGQGHRSTLREVMSNSPGWSFGPFPFETRVYIKITHKRDGAWVASHVVGPLTVDKRPERNYPMEFRSQTVISEDLDNSGHEDCTVTVLEYK
ncbi:hypothetical protein FRB94_001421 [Tulasnella sp. JGI-2019a]|nr:hypothetical protein FRB94_001421 [Tulasnella sp. JGI-2019a]KAG9006293.1 hypothetical protein FRB93_008782 [Tulasnella sp. JGI-2019a]KAG9037961.1 hypothetical protein FRB95_003354 [Tulasnella sp. JGI-2019a]